MKTTVTLAALLASVATISFATNVDDVSGTPTQQDITHIFDAANDLQGHDMDQLPADVQRYYDLWPTETGGVTTTTDVPYVLSIGISGGNFLADTRGNHEVSETTPLVRWRDDLDNRYDTLGSIEDNLFGFGNRLSDVDTNGFLPIEFIDEGSAAPAPVDGNAGIVGNAVDWVINCLLYTSPSPRD